MKRRKILIIIAVTCLTLCVLASVFLAAVWFWPDPRFDETMATGREELAECRIEYIFQIDSARDYRVAKLWSGVAPNPTEKEAEAFLKVSKNRNAAYGALFELSFDRKYLKPLIGQEDDPLACFILSIYMNMLGDEKQALHYAQRYAELDPGNAFAHLNEVYPYRKALDFSGQLGVMREAAKCTRYENPMAEVIRAYVDHAECFDSQVNVKAGRYFKASILRSSMRHMGMESTKPPKASSDEVMELSTLQLKSLDQVLQSPLMGYCYHQGDLPDFMRWKYYKRIAKGHLDSDSAIRKYRPQTDFSALEKQQNQAEEQRNERLRKASPAEVDGIIREELEALRRAVAK